MKVFVCLGLTFLMASGSAIQPGELRPPAFTPPREILPPVNVEIKDLTVPSVIEPSLRVGVILEIVNTDDQSTIYATVMKMDQTRRGIDVSIMSNDPAAVSSFLRGLKIGDSVEIFDERGNALLESPVIGMKEAAGKTENTMMAGKYNFRFIVQ